MYSLLSSVPPGSSRFPAGCSRVPPPQEDALVRGVFPSGRADLCKGVSEELPEGLLSTSAHADPLETSVQGHELRPRRPGTTMSRPRRGTAGPEEVSCCGADGGTPPVVRGLPISQGCSGALACPAAADVTDSAQVVLLPRVSQVLRSGQLGPSHRASSVDRMS